MLVDTCVEALNVFDGMISAVAVILLVTDGVSSDIKVVAIVAGRVCVDSDVVKLGEKPQNKKQVWIYIKIEIEGNG